MFVLRKIDTFSGVTNVPKLVLVPFKKGTTLTEKKLIPGEDILLL